MSPILDIFQPHELAICVLVVITAAILQMSVGMGFGMLASPLIALFKPEIVPASIMLIGLAVALSGAWRERDQIVLEELQLGIGGRILGSLAAVLVLASISETGVFMVVFGICILVAVVLAGSGIQIAFNRSNLFGLSVVSGLMGTITAVGAPPMAIIYHNRPPEIVRPTLNAFFAIGCVLGLAGLALSGWLRLESLLAAVVLFPAMLAGIHLSRYFRGLPGHWLSRGLLGLSGVAALLLIWRGIA